MIQDGFSVNDFNFSQNSLSLVNSMNRLVNYINLLIDWLFGQLVAGGSGWDPGAAVTPHSPPPAMAAQGPGQAPQQLISRLIQLTD